MILKGIIKKEGRGYLDALIKELESPGLPGISVGEKDNMGRNDPCYCGSGKKFKKCCIEKGKK
jgi:uncharacterized protein YecA (UPF0149 family)